MPFVRVQKAFLGVQMFFIRVQKRFVSVQKLLQHELKQQKPVKGYKSQNIQLK